MPASRHIRLALALPAALIATSLHAQAAREFTGDIGFVNTTGNAELTTVSVGQALKFSAGPWALAQTFGVVYGENAGTVNTSLWRGGLRGERKLGAAISLLVLSAWDRNTFAGIDSRLEESFGLGIAAIDAERRKLSFELGGGAVQQWNSGDGGYGSFPSARATGTFRQNFTSAAYIQQGVEVLPNLDDSKDLRINTESVSGQLLKSGKSCF